MARVITAPGIVRNVSKYLNSMRRVPFAIGKDDWVEVDSSTYTYEFVTAYVTTSSFDIGTFDKSVLSYAEGDISMEKKDGGGGTVFTTTIRPTGTVSGSIYIWDNNDNKVPVILEDTVVPIENGGTEATSVPGILSNLGLGSANDAQETLEFGDAVHEDVANNLTTTSEGYVLDARQGKVLNDNKQDKIISLTSSVLTYAASLSTDTQFVVCSTGSGVADNPTNSGSYVHYIYRKSSGCSVISMHLASRDVYINAANNGTWSGWETLAVIKRKSIQLTGINISSAGGYTAIAKYSDIGIYKSQIISVVDEARGFSGAISFHVNGDGYIYLYCSNAISNGNMTILITYT